MVTQDAFFYPHTLQTKIAGTWTDLSACRDQPNSRGQRVVLSDSSEYQFLSLVHIPNTEVRVLPGQPIRVLGKEGEIRIEKDAARFSIDELQNRLWL